MACVRSRAASAARRVAQAKGTRRVRLDRLVTATRVAIGRRGPGAVQHINSRPVRHPEASRDLRRAGRRRSSLLRTAGSARNEMLRRCGEKLELRALQWAQRRCDAGRAGKGESPAQASNGGLVFGTGVALCGDLKAGIAEEAMDDFAERFAGPEIGNKGVVKLKGASPDHASRGGVVQSQVARKRDRLTFARLLRYRVQTAVAHRVIVGLEAALQPDLGNLDAWRGDASEGPVGPRVQAVDLLRRHALLELRDQLVIAGMRGEPLVHVSASGWFL